MLKHGQKINIKVAQITHGADTTICHNYGQPALWFATVGKHYDITKLLEKYEITNNQQ